MGQRPHVQRGQPTTQRAETFKLLNSQSAGVYLIYYLYAERRGIETEQSCNDRVRNGNSLSRRYWLSKWKETNKVNNKDLQQLTPASHSHPCPQSYSFEPGLNQLWTKIRHRRIADIPHEKSHCMTSENFRVDSIHCVMAGGCSVIQCPSIHHLAVNKRIL